MLETCRVHERWYTTSVIGLQVFGFLLGIDLKGMGGGAAGDEDEAGDTMRSTPPPAPKQPETPQEEEEVRPQCKLSGSPYRRHHVELTVRDYHATRAVSVTLVMRR